MAPSKKQDRNGEEARLEPQIPKNSYPFSQNFTADLPEAETGEESTSVDTTILEKTGPNTPDPTSNNGETSGSAKVSDGSAPMDKRTTPEKSPAPSLSEQMKEVENKDEGSKDATSSESTSNTRMSSLDPTHPVHGQSLPEHSETPDIPGHDCLEKDLRKDETNKGESPSLGMPTLPPIAPKDQAFSDSPAVASPGEPANDTPPLPAAAFSSEDYLTADEAQAYIQGDSLNQTPVDKTPEDSAEGTESEHSRATTEPSTMTVPQVPPLQSDSQEHLSSTDDKQSGKQPAGKKQKNRLFGRKKDKTFDKTKPSAPSAPLSTTFFSSHPILRTSPTMPGGLSNALFNSCSFAPWLILTILFVVQTLFTLDVRALWYSDEVRHAAVFTSMLSGGNIFKLELNGQLYPDKPSLYFWFLRGLYEIFQEEGPRLYFGAAAISGLLYLWAALLLGRLAGRFDGRSLLAGGILLISGSYFMGVTHYARMDLLFSAFIMGSYTAFFMAFAKQKAPVPMVVAFTLGALACLTKGPLGLILPLSSLILFALWTGKARRFFTLDFFLGLIVAALIVGGWLAGLYTETSIAYIQDQIVGKQVLERAVDAFHHKAKWSYYLERLPIVLLPWVAIILCLPFHRLFSKNALAILAASRKPEREGQAFLWCIIISALIVLSAVSTKIIIYLLPVLPVMCLIAGRAVLQLSGKRAALFKLLLGLTLLVAGFALFIATLKIFGSFPLPEFIDKHIPAWQIPPSAGFFISTGILCAAALFLVFGIPSSRPEGVLLTLGLMATALAYPLFGMAAPSLDAILSPKAQGQIIKEHIAEGYYPLTYDMYDGVYTYYAGTTIEEVYSVEDIAAKLKEHPRVILAIQQRALDKMAELPGCFAPVHRQMIEQHEYVLLACPPLSSTPLSEALPAVTVSGDEDSQESSSAQGTTDTAPSPEATTDGAPSPEKVEEAAGIVLEKETGKTSPEATQNANSPSGQGAHEALPGSQEEKVEGPHAQDIPQNQENSLLGKGVAGQEKATGQGDSPKLDAESAKNATPDQKEALNGEKSDEEKTPVTDESNASPKEPRQDATQEPPQAAAEVKTGETDTISGQTVK